MKIAIFALAALSSLSASAQYYKTLPAGVRAAAYRNVVTSEVDSTYGQGSSLQPIAYDIEINAETIEAVENPTVKGLFAWVKDQNPEAFENLSAGAFQISGSALLNVQGYGMGYGITDKVTAYFALPIYEANVNMKYKRTKHNNFQEIADEYTTTTGNSLAGSIGAFASQTPDVLSGPTIQNAIVTQYGYKEIGNWYGEGPGDLELGMMWNFFEKDNYGLMLTSGVVAPTGMEDDPDILQDIAFGDGQWDTFAELGGGIRLSNSFIFNTYARYTYQFSADKELRIPTSRDNSIGDSKGTFNEKRGNKLLLNADTDYVFNDWLNFNVAYLYEEIGKSKFKSEYGEANEWLATDTNSSAHSVRLKGELTSVDLFMQKKFLLPAQIKLYYQTTVAGVNTPNVDRYEVEFRMFF